VVNLRVAALAAFLCVGSVFAQTQTQVRYLSSRPGNIGTTCSEATWPYLYIVGGTGTGAQNMMDCRSGVWVDLTTGTGTFARESSPTFVGIPTFEDSAGNTTVDIDCDLSGSTACELYMDSGGTNGEDLWIHNRGGEVKIQGCGAGDVGPVCAASDEDIYLISNRIIIGDGNAKDATLLFDLDADQSIIWDESEDGFAISDLISCGSITTDANGVLACADAITAASNYTQSFTTQTSVTLTHNLGTKNIIVACYDATDIFIAPHRIDIGAADPWDTVVTFYETETGRCVVNGNSSGRYTATVTATTTVTVTGSTHGLGTNMIDVSCYNDADPRVGVEPHRVTVDDGTNDVVITFFETETGKCVLQ